MVSLGALVFSAGVASAQKAATGPSQAEMQELTAWCNKLGAASKTNGLDVPYDKIVQAGLCQQQSFPASISNGKESAYWVDRPGFATPVTKTIYMGWCLSAEDKHATGANYAACLPDAEAFDDAGKAALIAELNDKKFPALAKTRMQAYFDAVKKRLADSKAAWTTAVAKGGLCEEVQKKAPEKALADVRAELAANAKALELAMAIRDKILANPIGDIWAKKVQVDCEPLRAATREFLANAKPASMRDALWKIREDAVGYNLMSSLELCDAASGKIHMASFENKIVGRPGAPATGERWAVRQAVLSAYRPKMSEYACGENFPLNQLEAQTNYGDPILKSSDSWSSTHNAPDVIEVGDGNSRDPGFGIVTVAAIKNTPEGPQLSFKQETRFEQTMTCKNTTFWGWDSSGHPFWNQDCKFDKGTSYKFTPEPMVFDPLSIVGVKVGDTIKFTSTKMSARPYTKTGLVVSVVKMPKGGVGETTALSFYGVPLAAKGEAAGATASAKGKGKGKGK